MPAAEVASQLSQAGYHGLFQMGERNAASAVFGEGRDALEEIVGDDGYDDLQRLLAAETLFRFADGYPPDGERETLGRIYARGLALTGAGDRPLVLTGNAWGYLYENDEGPLGEHLRAVGPAAVPHLAELLDDDAPLFYEGSQEAMLGAELGYRVKDAAAYYIGELTGTTVPFHRDVSERDAEIARLKDA
jgi:hypothetical protein